MFRLFDIISEWNDKMCLMHQSTCTPMQLICVSVLIGRDGTRIELPCTVCTSIHTVQ